MRLKTLKVAVHRCTTSVASTDCEPTGPQGDRSAPGRQRRPRRIPANGGLARVDSVLPAAHLLADSLDVVDQLKLHCIEIAKSAQTDVEAFPIQRTAGPFLARFLFRTLTGRWGNGPFRFLHVRDESPLRNRNPIVRSRCSSPRARMRKADIM